MRCCAAGLVALALGGGAAAQEPAPMLDQPSLSSGALAAGARSSQLKGEEVYARDADLGTIDDVIVDLQGARVLAVIVSVNGLFGGKLVAVPADAVKVGADDHLTIDLPIAAFNSAPSFTYADKSHPQ